MAALTLLVASSVIAGPVSAQELDDLLEISLSDLVEMDVTVASGIPESILDAPAAIVVISDEEIQQRGYTNLAEIVEDLPGGSSVFGRCSSTMIWRSRSAGGCDPRKDRPTTDRAQPYVSIDVNTPLILM